jgi:hypothetical protein
VPAFVDPRKKYVCYCKVTGFICDVNFLNKECGVVLKAEGLDPSSARFKLCDL